MTGKARGRKLQDFSAIAIMAIDSLRTKNRDSFLNGLQNFGKQSTKKNSENERGDVKVFKVLIANDDNF
jgi:hypothetical protein